MTPNTRLSSDSTGGSSGASPEKAWKATLGELELQLTPDTYEMYLHSARFLAHEDGTFIIAVPNGFVKDWLEGRLNRVVKRTLRQIMGREVEIKYSVQPSPLPSRIDGAPLPLLDLPVSHTNPSTASLQGQGGLPLLGDYTFASFVVGGNNRIAHAAAMSVADQPGVRYNPLFLYSGVGLGKTHLMHAIGHRARQAGLEAVYISCEHFTNELVAAIRTNTQEQFRARFRTTDLLLVDDIQFMAGKPSTQEEFFHTFNALHASGRQVVLACDRPPKAMPTLERRLQSRFEWGLIADIQAPDLENRVAILQAKAVARGLDIPYDVLETVARLVPTNVRELEGALTTIAAHRRIADLPLTPQTVETILADMVPGKANLEPGQLLRLVARKYGVSADDLAGPSRKQGIVRARQVTMYLLREDLDLSFAQIGKLLGGRDHATAIHSVRKIGDLLDSDDECRREIDQLRATVMAAARALVPVRL